MDEEDKRTLRHISVTLDEMLAVISEPKNKVLRIFEIGATIVTLFGALAIIDIVINWTGR